ncbi:MAG: hypothetical protein M0R74_14360, partial [Dehalococcoidia bacterium]|nr:hypothetical protein [Dehalococcoidia bacterium]
MATELSFLLKLEDQATNKLNEFRNTLDGVTNKQLKQAGKALTGFGAATLVALGAMTNVAMGVDQTRGAFEGLAEQAGVSGDEILAALKKASAGTISENDLMLAANRAMVLGVAENTDQFSALMEIARDRARVMGSSTTDAFNDIVTGIGRGSPLILDNLGILVNLTEANEEYAKSLGKTAKELSEADKQQALLNAVIKQGQSTIDQQALASRTAAESVAVLKASFSDIAAQMGTALLPIAQSVAGVLGTLANLIKSIPDPVMEVVVVVGLVAGAFAAVAGPILLFLGYIPQIIAGVGTMSTVFTALSVSSGPIGLVALAIAGLVAGGVLLMTHWDTVAGFAKSIWAGIVGAFENVKTKVLSVYNSGFGWLLPGGGIYKAFQLFKDEIQKVYEVVSWLPGKVGDALSKAGSVLSGLNPFKGLAKEASAAIDDIEDRAKELTSELKKEADQQLSDALSSIDKQRTAADQAYQDAIANIKKEYGVTEAYHQNKLELAREETEASRRALDDELEAARDACDEKIALLDKEYAAKLKTLDAETQAAIKTYQDQIDAIDAQTSAENKALEEQRNQRRIAELQSRIDTATTGEERQRATQELADLLAEIERDRLLDEREAQKDALQAEIDNVKAQAADKRTALEKELATKKQHEASVLEATQTRIQGEKELLDAALEIRLQQIANEAAAAIQAEKDKLEATKTRLISEETETKAQHERLVQEEVLYQTALNRARSEAIVGTSNAGTQYENAMAASIMVPALASGGIVTRPTMALIGEAGPEAVVPLNRGMGSGMGVNVTVNTMALMGDEGSIRQLA